MAQSAKNNVAELNGDLNKQIAVLREDIANLTSIVGEYGKTGSAQLRDAARQAAEDAKVAGQNAKQAAVATAETKYAEAEEAVRKNPATAVGIAAGLGFLVGIIASRR